MIAIGVEPKLAVANDIAAVGFASLAYAFGQRKRLINNLKDYQRAFLIMFPAIIVGAYLGTKLLYFMPEWLVLWVVILIACLGLLDFRLLAFMIPASILAGLCASKITDIVSEKRLEQVFTLVLALLLTYLIFDQIL